jgi:Bacterial regulatory proteins, gntR family
MSQARPERVFKVSRPTVGRALRDLQGQDLIERRAGSGTYVKVRSASSVTKSTFQQLGLILTSVGKPEIFDIICGELATLARVHNYGLWWDGTSRLRTDTKLTTQDVEDLCEQFIEKGVAGVFFVPFEHTSDNMSASNRIVQQLHHAGIPVVLIDRDVGPFPHPNTLDLIGIRKESRKREACSQTPDRARLRQPEPRRDRAPALVPSPYERCQAIFGRLFGRIVCRLHEMGSWVVAGFSDRTPYPTGKRSDGGCGRKSLPGLR